MNNESVTYCFRQGEFYMDTDAGANLRWHNTSAVSDGERLPSKVSFHKFNTLMKSAFSGL